jgi:hypothetical protein
MAKGAEPTQTTTTQLSPQQDQILGLAMPGIKQFAANVPQRYPGSTVAGFDPSQVEGQNLALGVVGAQSGLAGTGAQTSQDVMGGGNVTANPWDPKTNLNLSSYIDAATRPIGRSLTEEALPSIRGEASNTGNFGSSRQGIAEGLASGRASTAIGDTAAKLAGSVYSTDVGANLQARGQNIDTQKADTAARLQALGLLPATEAAQLAPATTTSGVGDVRQAMSQAQLGEGVSQFNYDQLAPFLQAQELVGLTGAIPGGGTKAVGNLNPANPWTTTLGGAATGAGLGAAIGGPVGAGVGGVGGGLLAYLTGR